MRWRRVEEGQGSRKNKHETERRRSKNENSVGRRKTETRFEARSIKRLYNAPLHSSNFSCRPVGVLSAERCRARSERKRRHNAGFTREINKRAEWPCVAIKISPSTQRLGDRFASIKPRSFRRKSKTDHRRPVDVPPQFRERNSRRAHLPADPLATIRTGNIYPLNHAFLAARCYEKRKWTGTRRRAFNSFRSHLVLFPDAPLSPLNFVILFFRPSTGLRAPLFLRSFGLVFADGDCGSHAGELSLRIL